MFQRDQRIHPKRSARRQVSRHQSEVGAVQGGSISPLLANVYLHYVFDRWVRRWRRKQAHGDVIAVRYADDFMVGFEHREEAERFLAELRERLTQFGLELHPEKTRLIPFGRKADQDWREGQGNKPGTFDFLGFTHQCGRTRNGEFGVRRRTMRTRVQRKLQEVKAALRKRMHQPIEVQGTFLRAVLRGHFNYYGVPMNSAALASFREAMLRLWAQALRRRSDKHRITRQRMASLATRWLPPARVCHPYPWQRCVIT